MPRVVCSHYFTLWRSIHSQEADQFLEWRGGLAQKREVEERARRMVEEVRGDVDGKEGTGGQ